MAAGALPFLLVGGLALYGGGFDLSSRGQLELGPRHIAALLAWALVIVLLVTGAGSTLRLRKPLLVPVVLIGALALLCGLSSLWSGSAERSINEANRVLAYWSFFIATLLLTQTSRSRQGFAQGITGALGFIGLLAVGSRLLPGVLTPILDFVSHFVPGSLHITDDGGDRLSYPLIYFNATGVLLSMGALLMLWTSRRGSRPWIRWSAAALLPTMLLGLYLTLSRGGFLAGIIGVLGLLALSRNRLLYLSTLAVSVVCTLPVVLAVRERSDLSNGIRGHAASDQGVTVFLYLVVATAIALVGFWLLQLLRQDRSALKERLVGLSRDKGVLRMTGAIVGLVIVVAAIAFGGRAWHSFTNNDVSSAQQGTDRLTQLSGTGRSDFWRVAIDSFEDKPIFGNGAGTFQFTWREQRSIPNDVRDAHSLYLESFSELGLVGGLLVLGLVGSLLFWGYLAWRNAEGEERERSAALLAVLGALAVVFGIDWFWEMPVVGAVLFLSAGVLINVRCTQLTEPIPVGENGHSAPGGGRRYALGIAGIAVGWLSIASLVAPLWTQHEIGQSQKAAADGDIAKAIDRADTARSIEPWAASPYVQLALLAQVQGDYPGAIELLNQAIDRENRNWQLYNLRSEYETQVGDTSAAAADLAKAKELNPLAFDPAAAQEGDG